MKVSLCSPQLPQWAWRLAMLVSPISANGLDRLAIQLAETVNTVAGANGQSTEEFAELIPHREKPPGANDRRVS
jgi:hypothetical protein